MPRQTIITDLIDTLHETLRYYDLPKPALNRAYAPGKWSAREILVHISDTETVLLDRLRRLAAEETPLLMAFDQDRWADKLFYRRRDLNLAKAQFEAARRGTIELARTLDYSVDSKEGKHSESGTRTFGQILTQYASHNQHHLEQIKASVEGREWKAG